MPNPVDHTEKVNGAEFEIQLGQWVKRKISVARANADMRWDEVSSTLRLQGLDLKPGNLMTKQARCSYTAVEFLALLGSMGIRSIDLPAHIVHSKAMAPADAEESHHQPNTGTR